MKIIFVRRLRKISVQRILRDENLRNFSATTKFLPRNAPAIYLKERMQMRLNKLSHAPNTIYSTQQTSTTVDWNIRLQNN